MTTMSPVPDVMYTRPDWLPDRWSAAEAPESVADPNYLVPTTSSLVGDRNFKSAARTSLGHTSGCLTYVARRPQHGVSPAYVGLLVRGQLGRTDFQQGDARDHVRSVVRQQIFSLQDVVTTLTSHDIARADGASVVEERRRFNPVSARRDRRGQNSPAT